MRKLIGKKMAIFWQLFGLFLATLWLASCATTKEEALCRWHGNGYTKVESKVKCVDGTIFKKASHGEYDLLNQPNQYILQIDFTEKDPQRAYRIFEGLNKMLDMFFDQVERSKQKAQAKREVI